MCCPCWLCWLAFGCIAPCGWAGCCGAPGGGGCWTWGCGWAAPWGGMTPVAAKNWLMEEHRSAIWAGSSDQLLSSACRMLSFRADRQTDRQADEILVCDDHYRAVSLSHIRSSKVILDQLSCHMLGFTGSELIPEQKCAEELVFGFPEQKWKLVEKSLFCWGTEKPDRRCRKVAW